MSFALVLPQINPQLSQESSMKQKQTLHPVPVAGILANLLESKLLTYGCRRQGRHYPSSKPRCVGSRNSWGSHTPAPVRWVRWVSYCLAMLSPKVGLPKCSDSNLKIGVTSISPTSPLTRLLQKCVHFFGGLLLCCHQNLPCAASINRILYLFSTILSELDAISQPSDQLMRLSCGFLPPWKYFLSSYAKWQKPEAERFTGIAIAGFSSRIAGSSIMIYYYYCYYYCIICIRIL